MDDGIAGRIPGDLSRLISFDPHYKIVSGACDGWGVYVVGGYLRDVLLQRQSADRDYAVTADPCVVAGRVRNIVGGTLVRFRYGPFCRLITAGGLTLDFSALPEGIEADLTLRDFTVNALAWSEQDGLLDPMFGRDDIRTRVIRMVSSANLEKDPLRIIRAYRLSHELSFSIEPFTRRALAGKSSLIRSVKAERITSEFLRLLKTPNAAGVLQVMLYDGVLSEIISSNCSRLEANIKALSGLEGKLNGIPLSFPFNSCVEPVSGISRKEYLLLSRLLSGAVADRLILSRRIRHGLKRMTGAEEIVTRGNMGTAELLELFDSAGDCAPDALILLGKEGLIEEYSRYLASDLRRILPRHELELVKKHVRGKEFGTLLRRARRGLFVGEIQGRKELMEMIEKEYRVNLT